MMCVHHHHRPVGRPAGGGRETWWQTKCSSVPHLAARSPRSVEIRCFEVSAISVGKFGRAVPIERCTVEASNHGRRADARAPQEEFVGEEGLGARGEQQQRAARAAERRGGRGRSKKAEMRMPPAELERRRSSSDERSDDRSLNSPHRRPRPRFLAA